MTNIHSILHIYVYIYLQECYSKGYIRLIRLMPYKLPKAIRGIHLDNLDAVVLVGDPMSATSARRMEEQQNVRSV